MHIGEMEGMALGQLALLHSSHVHTERQFCSLSAGCLAYLCFSFTDYNRLFGEVDMDDTQTYFGGPASDPVGTC